MDDVKSMKPEEFDYFEEGVLTGRKGIRIVVRVSHVGGGVVGQKHNGLWRYRVEETDLRGRVRRVLDSYDRQRTANLVSHEQMAGIVWHIADPILNEEYGTSVRS
jgi:hypothetical protein